MTSPDRATAAERRAAALRRAAQAKQHQAEKRAATAIRELLKTRQDITFRSVARTGGVSLDFLYAHTDDSDRPAVSPGVASGPPGVDGVVR